MPTPVRIQHVIQQAASSFHDCLPAASFSQMFSDLLFSVFDLQQKHETSYTEPKGVPLCR